MSEVEQQSSGVDPQKSWLSDEEFIKREWEGRQTDWLLQWFVTFFNRVGRAESIKTSIGVTLTIGGTQIAGDLISVSNYFDQLSLAFSNAFLKFDSVDAGGIKQLISDFGSDPLAPDGQPEPAPQYLHLEKVKVLHGNASLDLTNGLWRGKIATIDGFILGR